MILEAKNVLYSYKSKRDKIVLKNVSATFEEATFYAIVGSSGSGKTTFLSLLAGLDNPVSGNVLYGGEDIRKKGLNYHRRHNVSLVFQNYNLIDYLTTEENVKLGGRKDAGELLREVSIPREDWKRNVLQLSGGQQQRVAIARALLKPGDLIIADDSGICAIPPQHAEYVLKKCQEILPDEEVMRELIERDAPIAEIKKLFRKRYTDDAPNTSNS